ncbi:hypothetical protein ACGFZK_26895 [Streptomyces sp. NPDC048257]|uniref:hypothetical protein n=1 Tax=Streptomyces sp. NPDC048257 TaxID=3365526 RepID=UPI00371AC35D
MEAVRRAAEEFSGLLRGRGPSGWSQGAAGATEGALDVMEVLGDFHDEHPGVEIALFVDTWERMPAALLRGEPDLGGRPAP